MVAIASLHPLRKSQSQSQGNDNKMVKIKLAVVRNNGEILKRGIYGASKDAANRARKAAEFAKNKCFESSLSCKLEEFDITAINVSHIDLNYWTERYEIRPATCYHTKEIYWRVYKNGGIPMKSGLNDPTFTEQKANEYFAELLKVKVCKPKMKVYFIEFADGTKLREIA
ncbi:hypothetical protein [Nostoc sp.]|uniref:hypothetical protein n=1 Tax=Nostoc sp. TaxID=1180 RepID=UPI0035944D2B